MKPEKLQRKARKMTGQTTGLCLFFSQANRRLRKYLSICPNCLNMQLLRVLGMRSFQSGISTSADFGFFITRRGIYLKMQQLFGD